MRRWIPFFLLLLLLAGCASSREQDPGFRQIGMDDAVSLMEEEIPELPDKDQLILVYCRSGNRSKQASGKLVELGYTNIVEIGGINGWKGNLDYEKTNHSDSDYEPVPESGKLSLELIGPWHLDQEKNDLENFANSLELFPGYGEWGASMEIRGNGEMSWYIGAEGWHGTYSVEGNILHAQLTSDLEQSTQNWDLRITSENGTTGLEMDYRNMTIYWVYGDQEENASGNTVPSNWEKAVEDEPWKAALAEDLFAKYGVLIPKADYAS